MADNIKGIPFSTSDEGVDYIAEAKNRVLFDYAEKMGPNDTPLYYDDIYVVMFAYVLGGWKALLSTNIPDGKYYEITRSTSKNKTYVDVYAKIRNIEITH